MSKPAAASTRRLLWVDDDPPERFVYEKGVLEEEDRWNIRWARTLSEAVGFLSSEDFDALILDQMVCGDEISVPIWGGCRLLHWIRGTQYENGQAPWPADEAADRVFEGRHPLASNQSLPAIILSGYHNKDVLDATRKASHQDSTIQFLGKPVDLAALRHLLERT